LTISWATRRRSGDKLTLLGPVAGSGHGRPPPAEHPEISIVNATTTGDPRIAWLLSDWTTPGYPRADLPTIDVLDHAGPSHVL
jgi:hypothetical protein